MTMIATFALAVFLLIITPGPGVLSLAGVGAAYGFRSAFRYFLGLFIGTNLVALAVVTGLGALILASPVIRTALLGASIAYLLYLATRIALAGSRIGFIAADRHPGVGDGILLQILNPKAYVVNTTLFSGFVFFAEAYLLEVALKFVIVNAIWTPLHFLWLWAGSKIKELDLSPGTQRVINIGMALAMLGVVALAAYTTLA